MISPEVGYRNILLTITQDNTVLAFDKCMFSNVKLGLAVFDPGPCNSERVSLP